MSILQPSPAIRVKVKSFNENLVCFLCSGYLIRPVAVTECLHTFCRSCIVKYLGSAPEYTCPYCGVLIHETNPWDLLKEDKTLEDIIFKIVPKLSVIEAKRREDFYDSIGITDPTLQQDETKGNKGDDMDEDRHSTKSEDGMPSRESEKATCKKKSVDFYEESLMGFCLNCLRPGTIAGRSSKLFRQLDKKYIRCSSHLTVAHLKKYLHMKLCLPSNCEVDILCNGEIMGKHHTLEFIYMTRWRYKETLLTLDYRPKMELTEFSEL